MTDLTKKFEVYTHRVDCMEDNIISKMANMLGKGGKGTAERRAPSTDGRRRHRQILDLNAVVPGPRRRAELCTLMRIKMIDMDHLMCHCM